MTLLNIVDTFAVICGGAALIESIKTARAFSNLSGKLSKRLSHNFLAEGIVAVVTLAFGISALVGALPDLNPFIQALMRIAMFLSLLYTTRRIRLSHHL